MRWGWVLAAALSIALLITGLLAGEAGTVLERAVQICLSCIGIG